MGKGKREETIAKFERGLFPSERPDKEDGDETSHGGGCGLSAIKDTGYEVSYEDKSTLILMTRNYIEKYRAKK